MTKHQNSSTQHCKLVFDGKYDECRLSKSLDENIQLLKKIFERDDTFMVTEYLNGANAIRCAIAFIDIIVETEIINRDIIQPVTESELTDQPGYFLSTLMQQVLHVSDIRRTSNVPDILMAILSGHTILLVDHYDEVLLINTEKIKTRAIEEPSTEKVIRGPRDGFTESLSVNISLIRKRLLTPDLKLEFQTIGARSHTKVCVCYVDGIAKPQILAELKKRLEDICIDGIIGSGYIEELIKDAPLSLFKTIGSTERPDIVSAKLLEGRIAVIVDGSPAVLTLPYLFIEHFQTSEDYYLSFYFAAVNRILRILGFITTVSVPGLYNALVSFHQEVIPTPLFLSIAAAKQNIPFPTIVEALTLLIVFEILRETGTRMPSNMGQALSIVGALVIGQAAVEARFVSAPIVIVIALSGITGLMISRLTGIIIIYRIMLLLLSSVLGLYGFTLGMSYIMLHLFKLRSFGVPYMLGFMSYDPEDMLDTYIRAPWWYMKYRPRFIAMDYKRKEAGNTKK